MSKKCVVYAIHIPGSPFTKIGITKSLPSRVKVLQTACPSKLTVVHALTLPSISDARAVETACHRAFAESNALGEWFGVPHACIVSIMNAAARDRCPR